jgi:hypothetical protein
MRQPAGVHCTRPLRQTSLMHAPQKGIVRRACTAYAKRDVYLAIIENLLSHDHG